MAGRIGMNFTGSENPDVCQRVGQFCAMPATILFGKSYRIIARGEIEQIYPSAWQKVATVALSILLLPLASLITALGLFLTSCSVTHKADYKLIRHIQNLKKFEQSKPLTPQAADSSHEQLDRLGLHMRSPGHVSREAHIAALTQEAQARPHSILPGLKAAVLEMRAELAANPALSSVYREGLHGERAAARLLATATRKLPRPRSFSMGSVPSERLGAVTEVSQRAAGPSPEISGDE